MATRAPSPGTVERFHEISLLGMLAAGYGALAGSLDWPTAAVMAAALALRVWRLAAGLSPPAISRRQVNALALVCLVLFPLDAWFLSESLWPATARLVCWLAAVKILTAATRRDFAWVRGIALLELLAASLLSASPAFFVFLALFLLCAIAAFASGEVVRSISVASQASQHSVARGALPTLPRRLTWFSAALFAGILTMTGGMFFVLPRTARAALQRFVPLRERLPGFANEVSLGEIGRIKRRETPVMHIRSFGGGAVPPLRWRGAALTRFDGRRWFNPPGADEPLSVDRGVLVFHQARNLRPGRDLQYQVQLSAVASDTLFFAGNPQTVRINVRTLRRTPEGAIRVNPGSIAGLRYGVFAFLEESPDTLPDAARSALLTLPTSLDRRVYRLAREMTAGTVTQQEEARAIEQRLKRDYGYTLELPSFSPADPLAHFLFERRQGHCEYFASAMAVMLRAVGIPSRMATGFLSGVYNPVTGWQVVRASDAHTWVEAWIDGRGWTTFDPTPPDPDPAANGLWGGLALLSDAVGQFWQDWVLSYDLERQVVLASRLDQSRRNLPLDWIDGLVAKLSALPSAAYEVSNHGLWLVAILATAMATIIYGGAVRGWVTRRLRVRRVKRGEAQASDATQLYGRMLVVLDRRGFRKPAWITPAEFAALLPPSEMTTLVERITAAYNLCRFGGRREAALPMVELLERLPQAASVRLG